MRNSLEDSWRFLESQGEVTPRRADGSPFVQNAMPNQDDEELGFCYYKYRLEDADNGNLTLPRTLFGRSWFGNFSITPGGAVQTAGSFVGKSGLTSRR